MAKRRTALEVQRDRTEKAQLQVQQVLAEAQLKNLTRAYEAADHDPNYPKRGDQRSGDSVMQQAQTSMRGWARFLYENHDIAIAVVDDVVAKTIGPQGFLVEPCIMRPNGDKHEPANEAMRSVWKRFKNSSIETTRELPFAEIEAQIMRSLFIDGEVLVQHLLGNVNGLRHRGPIPYSIELLEGDFLPYHLITPSATQANNRIVHGVEKNTWREPVAYHLLFEHPGDLGVGAFNLPSLRSALETKRVGADRITHLKLSHRIGQTRGITAFHGVLKRLEDLKEYDDSERIAARVAAAFTAVITRSPEFTGQVDVNAAAQRTMAMAPGMIFDNMMPGEDVKTISNNRPNNAYSEYLEQGIRRVAGGTGTQFSPVARRYDGTFSSRRQELVEGRLTYGRLQGYYVSKFLAVLYRNAVDMAILTNQVPLAGVDINTLHDAEYLGPPLITIDPVKEAQASALEIESGTQSRHGVIREKRRDPKLVDAEIKADPIQQSLFEKPVEVEPDDDPTEEEAELELEDLPEAANA